MQGPRHLRTMPLCDSSSLLYTLRSVASYCLKPCNGKVLLFNIILKHHLMRLRAYQSRFCSFLSCFVIFGCQYTCLLSLSRQACSLMRELAVLSTTVRHKSMCLTDLSLVRAHSLSKKKKEKKKKVQSYNGQIIYSKEQDNIISLIFNNMKKWHILVIFKVGAVIANFHYEFKAFKTKNNAVGLKLSEYYIILLDSLCSRATFTI